MSSKWSIPALMVAGSGMAAPYIDPDAQAFITAAGITDPTQQSAINVLVIAAKANGWWTLCNAIYPMVGGTATTCMYNLKDPRDLDAAYRLTFFNTPTITNSGVQWNGTTQYANTHLNAATILSDSSNHLSYYSTSNTQLVVSHDIGANDNVNLKYFQLICGRIASDLSTYEQGGAYLPAVSSAFSKAAYFIGTRTAAGSPNMNMYRNATDLGATYTTDGGAVTLPSLEVFLGAINGDGVASNYTDRTCAFATIGAGVNSTIEALMYSDIQTFNTTLARQV